MENDVVNGLEAWIRLQLEKMRPEAEYLGYETRGEGLYFWIRVEQQNLWLIVDRRACRRLSSEELAEFLDEEDWLSRLLTERCVSIQMPGLFPTLTRPSGVLV